MWVCFGTTTKNKKRVSALRILLRWCSLQDRVKNYWVQIRLRLALQAKMVTTFCSTWQRQPSLMEKLKIYILRILYFLIQQTPIPFFIKVEMNHRKNMSIPNSWGADSTGRVMELAFFLFNKSLNILN